MRIRWTAGSDSCTPLEQNCGDTGPGLKRTTEAEEPKGW